METCWIQQSNRFAYSVLGKHMHPTSEQHRHADGNIRLIYCMNYFVSNKDNSNVISHFMKAKKKKKIEYEH